MAAATLKRPNRPTNAAELFELIEKLGEIDPARVRLNTTPGRATERDLVRSNARKVGGLAN